MRIRTRARVCIRLLKWFKLPQYIAADLIVHLMYAGTCHPPVPEVSLRGTESAAEVSGFPAVVSPASPNCTPPGKTNSSTWNASQWIHETPRIPPTSRQNSPTWDNGCARAVTYWPGRSAWAFRQVRGWIIENREWFREIMLEKCRRFNERIAFPRLYLHRPIYFTRGTPLVIPNILLKNPIAY